MNTQLTYPRISLKKMDACMLVFELNRETLRLMPESSELITSAATMASFLHRNQTRFVRGSMPRVPYIEHPLRVALRLLRWGVTDADLIAAALLHDIIEDCSEELTEYFGVEDETAKDTLTRLYNPNIAEYIDHVSNPPQVITNSDYQDHIRTLIKTESAALLIKASDLKDNAGSIQHQMGFGKDQRMLNRIRKYRPIIDDVAQGLTNIAIPKQDMTAQSIAAHDMQELAIILDTITDQYAL